MTTTSGKTRFAFLAIAFLGACVAHATPIITSVVENGGDGGQISARFTGQTFANTGGLGTITVGLFREDAPAYTDREYEWNSITNNSSVAIGLPSYLVNGEYIVPGEDRRDNTAYTLTITVSQPAFVYLLIDNRGSGSDGVATDPPDLGTGTNSLSLPFMQWALDAGFTAVKTGSNRTGNVSVPDEIGVDETNPTIGVGAGISVDQYASVYRKSVSAGSFQLGEQATGAIGRNMYGIVVTNVPEPSSATLLLLGCLGLLGCRARHGVSRALSSNSPFGSV